jgi:hypothetical protein
MKLGNTIKANKARILFALLVAIALGLDARREAASMAENLITNQLLGPAVCMVTVGAYGLRNLRKPYYILVSILGILSTIGGGVFWYYHQTAGFVAYFTMVPLNIGFLLIVYGLMVEHAFLKKDMEFKLAKWEIAAIVCAVGMVLAVNEAFWPLYYLGMAFPLWHAPFTREQKTQALDGALDGVLLGFFLIQSFAYYNRPYDVIRYVGTWFGSNMNALFYLEVLAAIAGKYFLARLRYRKNPTKTGKFWIVWHWIFLAGTVDFILFTMGRTALGVAGVMILLLGVLGALRCLKDKFGWVALRAVLFGAAVLAGLPIVYWTIRYIPAYCDHPLYYTGEWSDDKVPPRADVDDPRYVQFGDALQAMFGRIVGPDGFIHVSEAESEPVLTKIKLASAGDEMPIGTTGGIEDLSEAELLLLAMDDLGGEDLEGYLWTFRADMIMGDEATMDLSGTYGFKYIPKPSNFSACARLMVYKLYFSNLNLIGHRNYDSYFETRLLSVYHGHNLFAQWMYLFGIPAGGLAVLLLIYGIIRSRQLFGRKCPDALVCLLFYVVHVGFGMLECAFFPGQAIIFFSCLMPFFLMAMEQGSLWAEYLPEEN